MGSVKLRVGVDTGGTFTDLVAWDGRGLTAHKLPSTPGDPARAVLEGLAQLVGEKSIPVVHGSTVATNAILEGKGARTGLVTTAGFEDLLAIGRQARPRIYDLLLPRPQQLVPAERRLGIRERVGPGGEILVALEDEEIGQLRACLEQAELESVAVCLLFSYANPAHETRLSEAFRALGVPVSISSTILPEHREYERLSTTVLSAYVAPLVDAYLERLEGGVGGTLRVMQSNGGQLSAAAARREPVRTVLSGPAGGVVGARRVAAASGITQVITFDMGGTSTDVSLCPGRAVLTTEYQIAGKPLALPVIDIETVGAGGGSIARLDPGGALKVGPESAGAEPGPVCYGMGEEITVTDAHVYLGRLLPEGFLGGAMALVPERIGPQMERLAREAGLTPEELAQGIVAVANASMERAMRRVSLGRGEDPRRFDLVCFGGAGALHAAELARALGMRRVLVPRHPGLLSALGMLVAEVAKDSSQTVLLSGSKTSFDGLKDRFAPLVSQTREEMAREGVQEGEITWELALDMRYQGQSYELNIPFESDYQARFHRTHQFEYGFSRPGTETEVVTLRVRALGPPLEGIFRAESLGEPDASEALRDRRPVRLPDGEVEAAIYVRDALRPGHRFAGPAVVTEFSSTTLVPPDFTCQVDSWGSLVVERIAA